MSQQIRNHQGKKNKNLKIIKTLFIYLFIRLES